MGQVLTQAINPYASPTLGNDPGPASRVPQRAIVLHGQAGLEHDLRVASRLRGRGIRLLIGLSAAGMILFSVAIAVQSIRLEKWTLLPSALGPLLLVSLVMTWQRLLIGALKGLAWISGNSWHRERPIELVADAEGLRVKDRNGEVFRRWPTFGCVQFADDLVVLFGNGDLAAWPLVVFSLRWCASVADQDALVALLQARVGHGN